MASIYGTYLTESYNKSEDNYKAYIKKNESKIKKFINDSLKTFFNAEKDNKKKDSNYDWRTVIEKCPSVKDFDYKFSDYVFIDLKYDGFNNSKYHDMILFFESDFVDYLKSNKSNSLKGFSFDCEDYPGIIIDVNNLQESVKFDGKSNNRYKTTNLSIEGIKVSVRDGHEDKLDQLEKDFKVLKKEYKSYIDSKFIPWLKGNQFKDISDKDIKNGIKLDSVDYGYIHIISKYSPTGKDDYFGEFELVFVPTNETTKKVFDCSSITLYIKDNKVAGTTCTDV